MKKAELIFLILFILLLFTQKSIAQILTTFNFQKVYAIGELANLPDSIILVADTSEISYWENYTTVNKIKNYVFSLDFWLMEKGGIVDPVSYKCNLKIKLKGNTVCLKFCKKKAEYFVKNIGTDKKEKLLLKKIITLPEIY